MELKELLTESERKTRRYWLFLLSLSVLMNAIVFFGLLGTEKMPTPGLELPLALRFFGFGSGTAFCYLYYALCYRRRTTFLLTFSLVAFWLSLLVNVGCYFQGMLEINLFFCSTLCTGVLNYLVSRKMRHINKALKAYAKFPAESREAAALIQNAATQEDLKNFFAEGLNKWPRLKWVLHRERTIKEKILR